MSRFRGSETISALALIFKPVSVTCIESNYHARKLGESCLQFLNCPAGTKNLGNILFIECCGLCQELGIIPKNYDPVSCKKPIDHGDSKGDSIFEILQIDYRLIRCIRCISPTSAMPKKSKCWSVGKRVFSELVAVQPAEQRESCSCSAVQI